MMAATPGPAFWPVNAYRRGIIKAPAPSSVVVVRVASAALTCCSVKLELSN